MPLKIRFRPAPKRPDLTTDQILAWADQFEVRFGRWPMKTDGRRGLTDTTWSAVDACLKNGSRGLPGGSTLAKLLLEHRGRRHKGLLPPLTPDLVLTWADEHHARTGDWPTQYSGSVAVAPGETWSGVQCALNEGCRTLPGGSSIAQLLEAHRGVRNHYNLPPLTPELILGWADAHHARTGRWPRKDKDTGPIPDAPDENWAAVDQALLVGVRGLPGGSSLARLLDAERGVRNPAAVPKLEHWEILVWADHHFDRTGRWPTANSGAIPDAPGEVWSAVDAALTAGTRGLPGNDSLARLLARRRGKRNSANLSPLTPELILGWADAHHARTGEWPHRGSGAVADAPGETWQAIVSALHNGRRGLPGGSSLARLLDAERGVASMGQPGTKSVRPETAFRNPAAVPKLTVETILVWADAHHQRTGEWPKPHSGPIPEAPGEHWSAVAAAVGTNSRGLTCGGSLAQLLAAHRGVRNHMALPPFSVEQILNWADAHHARTGEWPTRQAGEIPDAPDETWGAVEQALSLGLRGLPGGDSLAKLLARHRGKRNRKALPPLTLDQIRGWVADHFRRTGEWPSRRGGPIHGAAGETWGAVDQALYVGLRGLPGGSSLPKVVAECRANEPAVVAQS